MYTCSVHVPVYLCTSVPLQEVRRYVGGTYLGNLHIGQADKIQCQDLHVFFSLGELLVFWFIGRYWKMIDPTDAGPWESFFYLFVVFLLVFLGGGGFLAYVSKVLGRKKEGTT